MENGLDRSIMKDLLEEIGPALKEVATRNGVAISCGTARFNALSGTIVLEITPAKTESFDPEQERWNQLIQSTLLKPEDFRSHVVINGTDMVISGINPKARTNKIILLSSTGKEYVTNISTVERALKRTRRDPVVEETARRNSFKLGAMSLGLKVGYGDILTTTEGKEYRLVEINLAATKYPIIGEDLSTGAMVKMPAQCVATGRIREG